MTSTDVPVQDLMAFLDASPSPWHAADTAAGLLADDGFVELDETAAWDVAPVAGFVRRGGALIAWRLPESTVAAVRVVGAHTDSPGLRIHPRPDQQLANWRSLGVEVYGGVLLNSWLDRDLGVAGRVIDTHGVTHLVNVDEPIARVPQLAIHLDRNVNDGLTLDRHQHLRPVWSLTNGDHGNGNHRSDDDRFADWLGERAGCDPAGWELCLYDVQPARVLGADGSLLASGRLDNLVSCWAATRSLIEATGDAGHISVAALFDHEEVGSASTAGASGPLLETVVGRLLAASGVEGVDERARVLVASSCVSADNAHAIHPNYPDRHDGRHAPLVNRGPAVKLNANQRYATDADTAALFTSCCAKAGVPVQTFVSRNNVPCGSTIGPLTATRMGIATVDVGIPQLSMHSARELCGVADPGFLAQALTAYYTG